MKLCPICGPKLSVCCAVLSVWGIVMLAILGGLLKIRSIAFAEDILADIKSVDLDDFGRQATDKYDNAAYSTWVAAVIYVLTLAFSLFQAALNKRSGKL
ncbi:ribonuclease kappa-B-like [Oppia nitens]|uniref:ribonuclease kappa-B-like n=1 Tax=Oppia nitens TaxID=1686743 RepID=UPI0023D9A203|nr:ribonuclease kappa-B-like [Oppia nitens]